MLHINCLNLKRNDLSKGEQPVLKVSESHIGHAPMDLLMRVLPTKIVIEGTLRKIKPPTDVAQSDSDTIIMSEFLHLYIY